jgi:hypothetical protein
LILDQRLDQANPRIVSVARMPSAPPATFSNASISLKTERAVGGIAQSRSVDPVAGQDHRRDEPRRLQLRGQLSPFRDIQRAQSAFFSAASTAALSGQIALLS